MTKAKNNSETAHVSNPDPSITSNATKESPAVFHRHEIRTGQLVGEGSFAQVYEIMSIELDQVDETEELPFRRRKRQMMQEEQNQNTIGRCLGRCSKSRYVVKHLHRRLLREPKAFRRAAQDMKTEIVILSKCKHPNIIRVRGVSHADDVSLVDGRYNTLFFIMDRLNETLDQRIHQWNMMKVKTGPSYYQGPINGRMIALKAKYALQIASALKYLHDRDTIYRDLKPQNIGFCVGKEHKIKLFDFGLARELPRPKHGEEFNKNELFHMSMVGTRRYMSPEVLAKRYNTKADVYSWSMVFFEMLTQNRPFDGIRREEHKELVCKHGRRPKIYSYFNLPKVLENLLRRSWAQLISQRLTMDEVCATLEAFLDVTVSQNATLDMVSSICVTENTDTTTSDTSISSSDLRFQVIDPKGSMDEAACSSGGSPSQRSLSIAASASEAEASVPEAIAISIAATASSAECTHDTLKDVNNSSKRLTSLCDRVFNILQKTFVKCINFVDANRNLTKKLARLKCSPQG